MSLFRLNKKVFIEFEKTIIYLYYKDSRRKDIIFPKWFRVLTDENFEAIWLTSSDWKVIPCEGPYDYWR